MNTGNWLGEAELAEARLVEKIVARFEPAENERRVGYAWYGDWPADVLGTQYPAWVAEQAP